jgi:hypothetical protein
MPRFNNRFVGLVSLAVPTNGPNAIKFIKQ